MKIDRIKKIASPVQHPAEIRIQRALKLFQEICASCSDCRYHKCPGWAVKQVLEGKE